MKNILIIGIVASLVSINTPGISGELTVSSAVEIARVQDVTVIGEVHDNPIHHFVQSEFAASTAPTALVFEMILQSDEDAVNRLREAGATRAELATALDWENAGWPAFGHYAQIMEAAPGAKIYGAALPREKVRAAVKNGAASEFGDQAAVFGLLQPLPPEEQAAREAAQMEAHCDALPVEMLSGMVEAQRLRDAALAAAVLRARADTEGIILVITGNGHADTSTGMPAVLSNVAPQLTVFSFAQLEALPDSAPPYDGFLVTEPVEREDPCAAFSKS